MHFAPILSAVSTLLARRSCHPQGLKTIKKGKGQRSTRTRTGGKSMRSIYE